jgi:hypothetical protein
MGGRAEWGRPQPWCGEALGPGTHAAAALLCAHDTGHKQVHQPTSPPAHRPTSAPAHLLRVHQPVAPEAGQRHEHAVRLDALHCAAVEAALLGRHVRLRACERGRQAGGGLGARGGQGGRRGRSRRGPGRSC